MTTDRYDTDQGRPAYRHRSGIAWTNYKGRLRFTSDSGMTDPGDTDVFKTIYESLTDELGDCSGGDEGDVYCIQEVGCCDHGDCAKAPLRDRDCIMELTERQALFYVAWQLSKKEDR